MREVKRPKALGGAENLLQLLLQVHKKRCCCTNNPYFRVNRFQLELWKFYIRITSTS